MIQEQTMSAHLTDDFFESVGYTLGKFIKTKFYIKSSNDYHFTIVKQSEKRFIIRAVKEKLYSEYFFDEFLVTQTRMPPSEMIKIFEESLINAIET